MRNMRNISVHRLDTAPIFEQNVEYIERKGIGHPDSLIDGIVDATSHALCKEYINSCGLILHHNVDKGLIIGGAAEVGFGKAKITKKIEVIVTGRATDKFENTRIEVNDIAKEVARKYLKENSRFLDLDNEVIFDSKIAMGSADLTQIFARGKDAVPLANDTSFGIGFAPFSDTERLVLETENYLNSKDYKRIMPSVGEDIKVMGVREREKITLTIGIAFVANYIHNIEEYINAKERVRSDVGKFAKKLTDKEVNIHINTGDSLEGAEVYLTKSGLSCEAGDDGSVGRGNRVNGLITPFRHMSLEAAAGKNPVSHIGKIYNILATELSKDIVNEVEGITECDVAILSQIGKRIDEPLNLNMNLKIGKGASFESIETKAKKIADRWLEDIGKLTIDISLGKYKTF